MPAAPSRRDGPLGGRLPGPPRRPDGRLRVALVGAGLWGQNLLRVLCEHPRVDVRAVVDPSAEALARSAAHAPLARLVATLDEALDEPLDAAVIACPAEHHAASALSALGAGLDVLVEKPLATSSAAADAICALAHDRGRIAMVGHLLLHHPSVAQLLSLVRRGALGRPLYLASARLSPPGRRGERGPCVSSSHHPADPRGDDSVLWALGPHDLSVLHAIDPSPLRAASAMVLRPGSAASPLPPSPWPSGSPLPPAPDHVALVHATLQSGMAAQLELSRVHAFKERRLLVAGDEAIAIFDDMRPEASLQLARTPRGLSAGALLRHSPAGQQLVPVEPREPLAVEVAHFVRCVETRERPSTPAEDGALIVRWLEEAEQGRVAPTG
jgi:predicted dehydrogenase